MNVTKTLLQTLLSLDKKSVQQYKLLFILGSFFVAALATYYTDATTENLTKSMKKNIKVAMELEKQTITFQSAQIKKKNIFDALEKQKNTDIKSVFETLCRSVNIQPQPQWNTTTRTVANSEYFEEITLQALFKQSTMETLVSFLKNIENNEVIHVKDLKISRTKQSENLDFDVVLSMLRPIDLRS